MGIKIAIIMGAIMATMCGGFYWYYQDSQARIATLRENNAKLEVAVQTAEASIATLREDAAKMAELNNELQVSLQKAEAYGDDLRNKLRQTDIGAMALRDPETLEGKTNGATAKLWREFMSDTGNTNDYPIPDWLQQTRKGSSDSDTNTENSDSDSSETETAPTS